MQISLLILVLMTCVVDDSFGQPAHPVQATVGCDKGDNEDLQLSCTPDRRISIYGVYFALDTCTPDAYNCYMTDPTHPLHDEIFEACNGNTECLLEKCDDKDFENILVEYQCPLSEGQVGISTVCDRETLHISCPMSYMIIIDNVYSGKDKDGEQCVYNVNHDCLDLVREELRQEIVDECQNKTECKVNDVRPDFINNCGRRGKSYVMVEYHCITGCFVGDYYRVNRCSGLPFDTELCPHNTSIAIQDVLFHHAVDDQCKSSDAHECGNNETTMAARLSCEGKRGCVDALQNENVDLEIVYSCQNDSTLYEISKCAGDEFNELLCEPPNSEIQLVNAFYGDMGRLRECSNVSMSQYDCRVNVKDYNTTYFKTIEEKCQGNSCAGLLAESQNDTFCGDSNGSWNIYTDYVTIVYRCIEEPNDPTTEGDATIRETSLLVTSTESAVDNSSVQSKTNPRLGIVVGVPVAAVVVAISVILVVVFLKRNNGKQNPSARSDNIGANARKENVYSTYQDEAKYENIHNTGPLVYSLATGSVRLTNSTRDETDTDMIVYDNDNYTPYPRAVNKEDFSQVKYSKEEIEGDMILCDNANYSSFTGPEDSQNDTVIEDNVNYAGYESEYPTNKKGLVQATNDEEDETVLFENQQYASTDEAVPSDGRSDEDIITENLNYEAWDQ